MPQNLGPCYFFLTYEILSEAPTDDDGHACVYVRFSGTFVQLIRMERDLRRIKKEFAGSIDNTLFVCLPLPLPRSLPPSSAFSGRVESRPVPAAALPLECPSRVHSRGSSPHLHAAPLLGPLLRTTLHVNLRHP